MVKPRPNHEDLHIFMIRVKFVIWLKRTKIPTITNKNLFNHTSKIYLKIKLNIYPLEEEKDMFLL